MLPHPGSALCCYVCTCVTRRLMTWRSVLAVDPEESQEDVEDVQEDRRRGVDGVVQRPVDVGRAVEVEDQQAAEDDDADPVPEVHGARAEERNDQHADQQDHEGLEGDRVPLVEVLGDGDTHQTEERGERQRGDQGASDAVGRVLREDRADEQTERAGDERVAGGRDQRLGRLVEQPRAEQRDTEAGREEAEHLVPRPGAEVPVVRDRRDQGAETDAGQHEQGDERHEGVLAHDVGVRVTGVAIPDFRRRRQGTFPSVKGVNV